MGVDLDALVAESQFKKRKVTLDGYNGSSPCSISREIQTFLPTLQASDYFTEPCLTELVMRELMNPGHSQRVQNFTVGRYGYGKVKFFGETDVRWLDLDQIIKFKRHEIVVYEDETTKPVIGKGLNKAAEVTLLLQITSMKDQVTEKLRVSAERQGAKFISFDSNKKEWKFTVQHFSRFGLSDDEEEDIAMGDADSDSEVQEPIPMNDSDGSDPHLLSHSLPSHLGLDPVRMKEMQMVMFPYEEDEHEELNESFSHHKQHIRSPIHHPSTKTIRKTPLALLEYNPGSFGSTPNGSILLTQQKKPLPLTITKVQGFKMEIKETPVTKNYSRNIVDAALFMGKSFGIAWGPNGLLLHCNSSTINLQKAATDNVVRDENNKVREELIDSCFDSPLNFHKELNHETKEVVVDDYKIKIQKLVCDRFSLSHICRSYISIIEKQLEVPGLSPSKRVMLMHQVLVWELIKVLFSSREISSLDPDMEALPLIRRAEFSYWLQESVMHRVQDEISSLNDSNDLQHLFLLLTGRQLDTAVELSASQGDVRLAMLLSQAGGSMVNRSDLDHQLNLWKTNGLDFSFIEKDRIKILELLSGNIHEALGDMNIDWKRFLGLLMWYQLPPDSDLVTIFQTYHRLLENGRAPYPVPVYIDEGVVENGWTPGNDRFDLAYYLMILHGSEEREFGILKTMLSAFASSHDPLDHHMIWHQRGVLEAVGTFSCDDLHVLDMGFVSQLLSLGHCHWAIYVVLHMSHREDYPNLQACVIKEILFQYCETWSGQESQREFIEELGIPSAWMHEALAVYHGYYGNSLNALEHYLGCGFWQKAHSTFMSVVAHSLFLSGKHSEIWRIATSMEEHKSEIENWDVGAGIYMTFYTLRISLEEDDDAMTEMQVSLKKKNDECKEFFNRLKESLAVWDSRLPLDARMVYAKMAEEISDLLVGDPGEGSSIEDKLECFSTIFDSPIPDDILSCHLQSAVSHFALHLTEAAS
ncbi:unnamed protein product [Lactuca saligna]|uniref:Peptidase S59 domain-containing protein n=1 Tax=Lactuca saligna TaxID=75948 RepID=A0AA35YCQ8_LACSI|nr:unnamed protein product [Lactuca saligna]